MLESFYAIYAINTRLLSKHPQMNHMAERRENIKTYCIRMKFYAQLNTFHKAHNEMRVPLKFSFIRTFTYKEVGKSGAVLNKKI